MTEISIGAFLELKKIGKPFTIYDIRETYEVDIVGIGATHLPMASVLDNLDKLPKEHPVIFFCKSGQRAGALVALLRDMYNINNVFSLQGGILGYINQVEPSLPTY